MSAAARVGSATSSNAVQPSANWSSLQHKDSMVASVRDRIEGSGDSAFIRGYDQWTQPEGWYQREERQEQPKKDGPRRSLSWMNNRYPGAYQVNEMSGGGSGPDYLPFAQELGRGITSYEHIMRVVSGADRLLGENHSTLL